MIAFLDSSALIYLIEGAEPFASQVRRQLAVLVKANPQLSTAVSRLAWLECRTGPMRSGEDQTLSLYDTFFCRPDLITIDLTGDVIDLATVIRAHHGLKTPDALQAACCLQLGEEHLLLTGDKIFRRVAGVNVSLVG